METSQIFKFLNLPPLYVLIYSVCINITSVLLGVDFFKLGVEARWTLYIGDVAISKEEIWIGNYHFDWIEGK